MGLADWQPFAFDISLSRLCNSSDSREFFWFGFIPPLRVGLGSIAVTVSRRHLSARDPTTAKNPPALL